MLFDISMIFCGQARAYEIAEHVNHSLSIGHIEAYSEAETLALESIGNLSPNAKASTSSEDYMIRTVVRIPSSDIAAVGLFSSLTAFEVTAVAQLVRAF